MNGSLTGGGDVAVTVESGGEDVLGAVEEDEGGRELPRLCPRRHGQSEDLGTGACAWAQGLGGERRCLPRCREEEMPHGEAFARDLYGHGESLRRPWRSWMLRCRAAGGVTE